MVTFTLFSRENYPTNLFSASEWRKFAAATDKNSILAAQRHFASIKGGAIYHRADGALVVFTKLAEGKIRQTTYKPGKWGWSEQGA